MKTNPYPIIQEFVSWKKSSLMRAYIINTKHLIVGDEEIV